MVIDSSLFIEFFRTKDRSKTALAQLPAGTATFISAVSIFELFVGANTPEKVRATLQMLNGIQVLPLDEEVAKLAGRLFDELQRSGQALEFRDVMIAATAIFHEMPIKTLNIRHFSRIPGLVLA
jgi:tRNA(fMet)-specific endonuclease VapC